MDASESVFQLITRLCETLVNNNSIGGQINKESVKKARSKCYEILLSKKLITSHQYLKYNSDALCNLLSWHFYLLWEGRVPEHTEKLQTCIGKLQDLNIFKNSMYSDYVLFLLQLRKVPIAQHKIMDTTVNRDALRKFKEDLIYDDSRFHLPQNGQEEFNSEQFKLHKDVLYTQLKFKYVYEVNQPKCENIERRLVDYRDEGYESPTKDEENIWEMAALKPINNHRTWETFGTCDTEKELPFVSEAGPEAIAWIYNLPRLERAVAGTDIRCQSSFTQITQKEFVKCVKYLLVGIESHVFKYDGNDKELILVSDINVKGLSTLAITLYCKDLIACASCYKGLNNLCTICPIDLKNEQHGYIFLELCASIKRYLSYFRVAVLALSDTLTLLTIHQQTRSLRNHITLLASVCKVGPFKESGEILHGVVLLNYLFEKVVSLVDEASLMVFYAVIYPCCKVYFRRFLQQWLLDGTVNDPYNEFFIASNSKYISTRGRTYWTRSFVLRKDIVPDFLLDMIQDILFCGKAMNLLKLCVPNSALCLYLSENHPNILHCCLLPEQLSVIEHNNYCYYLETTILSGPRVSLAEIMSQARDQNSLFLHLVVKKRAATISRIELERKKKLQEEFEKKQVKMKHLRNQYFEAMAFKNAANMAELEREINMVEHNIKLQALQNKVIEEEKAQIINYYARLNAESEKRLNYYKQQIENFKCELNINSETVLQPEQEPEPESTEEILENEGDRQSPATSYHSFSGDYESKSEYSNAIADSDSSNLECDIINANTNINNTDVPLGSISETYKAFLENKKAAEKNKAKVLSLEMGETTQPVIIKNLETTTLTDAQKNKLKVMSSEFGMEMPHERSKIRTGDSAAEANKFKVLGTSDCFKVDPLYDNFKKQSDCDNENYINRNVKVDTNTNIIETSNALSKIETLDTLIDNLTIIEIKKPTTLRLDFSKLDINTNDKKTPSLQTISAPKFELQKISPMSIDSASISSVTTPNFFDNLKNCPSATTAKTDAFSEASFIFESDSLMPMADFERRKSEYALQKKNEIKIPDQLSNLDMTKISPGCLKFCLQQSVLIPLITQMKLVTNELMKYYINDLHYLQHLNSLRNYFFLLDGEFCRNITEGLFGKLYDVNFPIDLLNLHTLQILVFNALDYSTKCQENSHCLSFKINTLPKIFNLCNPDVFDCISLVYKTSWPLNILLPADTITKYDDVFKLLLKVHRVSWVLHNIFQDLKLLGKEVEKPYRILLMASRHYLQLHHYRHVMTQFIQSLQSYIVGEVLQTSWHIFEKNLESVNSFDQLYALHSTYIKNILFLCLLNQKSAPLRTALQKIFIVILKFFSYFRSRCWNISDDNVYIHPNFNKLETLFNNFEDLVLYFFKLGHKVVKSGYQPQLMQLLDMLDVNNYYSKKLQTSSEISTSK